jgi:branched-chain amino acid transport system ATP-binding protein
MIASSRNGIHRQKGRSIGAAAPVGEPKKSTCLIEATSLALGYGEAPIVRDLNFQLHPGEVVALLGPNGAGKTTTLLGLAGELRPLAGEIKFRNVKDNAPLHRRAAAGLSFVTEERSVFMSLTVEENLRLGRKPVGDSLRLFPELEPLLQRRTGLLSGGEQQMVTLARALARDPQILLADELSLGLAPMVIDRLLRAVRKAADAGVGVLIVEQQIPKALTVCDRVCVMQRGEIVWEGTREEARQDELAIEMTYMS